jgi:hypothetical protein
MDSVWKKCVVEVVKVRVRVKVKAQAVIVLGKSQVLDPKASVTSKTAEPWYR